MKKQIFFVFLTILLTLLSVQSSKVKAAANLVVEKQSSQTEAKQLDRQAQILAAYLQKFDSPLQYHTQDLIDAAKKYNLDWKLVTAIAGVESTFGKFIPGGYNGWGWGAYDANRAVYFNSWTEAINTISQSLREDYINNGYTEPFSMNKIYAKSPYWGSNVTFFMNDLEKFASQFGFGTDNTQISDSPKIAAVSASPVIR